jgi:hypothetical protein
MPGKRERLCPPRVDGHDGDDAHRPLRLYSIFDMSIKVFSFGNDLDGDRIVDVLAEQITYALSLSGPRQTLLRNGQPTVEFVEPDGLTFEYLNEFGEPAKDEPDASLVHIELRVEVKGRAQTLATEVALRNQMQ